MNEPLNIAIQGIGVWTPTMPDWQSARDQICGKTLASQLPSARPSPAILPPNERRRAPEAVLLALDVALQACTMSGHNPRDLPNVFACAFGDLAINDYMCDTLARAPLEISPTRFHNSVHNAAAGYWAIASGCMQTSTALSASSATFGAGLLEATLLALDLQKPVLSVAYDVAALGALNDVIPSRAAFAVAFVLAPPGACALGYLRLQTQTAGLAPQPPDAQAGGTGNPIAWSLPLLESLARAQPGVIQLAVGPELNLSMETHFD